jgi:hypothetical protein
MRMILGLDRPTAGSVTVNGKQFAELYSPMREVGALLDAKAVHGGRSAYNHLLCLAQTSAVLLSAAIVTVFGLLAYGAGAIIRHTAGAITAILGVIFLIPALAEALPASWFQALVRWQPGGQALGPIARSGPPLEHFLFSARGEFAVFSGYAAVLLALGAWLFIRRDA